MGVITPDEIIRSRRKTLAISVDPFGRLIVRAPFSCSEARIFAFIKEKEGWIAKQKGKAAEAGVELPDEDLDGFCFYLLGRKHTLRLTDGKRIAYDEGTDTVFVPRENAEARLVKWLKENARRIFVKVTEKQAALMGVTYKSVSITSARGRWGSCSHDNALRYSFRLLYAPKEVIEYVVTHELAHTKHKDHSKAFWAEVAKYVPDWKAKRGWLKERRAVMEVF